MNRKKHNRKTKKVNNPAPMTNQTTDLKSQIVEALIETDRRRAEVAKAEKDRIRQNTRRVLGIKDYSDKKPICRFICRTLNAIWVLITIPFRTIDDIEGTRMSTGLIALTLSLFFGLISLALYITSIFTLFAAIYWLVICKLANAINTFSIALSSCMLGSIFKVAKKEIEKTNDTNFLFGLFASVTAIISIVIAIIAIIKGRA